MADRVDPGQLDSPVLAAIYAYWRALSGGRAVVAWSEIAPERIPRKALPYVIAAQRLPDGDFRYRISGTAVDSLIGVVPQGRRLSELPLDRDEAVRRDFDRAIDELRPVLSSFPIRTPADAYPEARRLVFPVSSCAHGGRAADMVFGAVSYLQPES
jgi:hypothetical protein